MDKKWSKPERRNYILEEIKTKGVYGVNKLELARTLNVNYKTVLNDFDILVKQVPKEIIELAGAGMILVFQKSIRILHSELDKPELTTLEMTKTCEVLADLCLKFTKFLEVWGYKKEKNNDANFYLEEIFKKWEEKRREFNNKNNTL
ncbi:hypothetical protein HY837_02865 [archaeon]|nr:hypothetical protein [archaeon]